MSRTSKRRSPGNGMRLARLCLGLAAVTMAISGSVLHAAKSDPVLVRVFTKSARSHVGILLREDENEIVLKDLETGQELSIAKREALKITKPLTLDDAASASGIATVAGWKIGLLAAREKPMGKIARVTPQVIYVTLGDEDGTRVGQKLVVFRNKGEIKDPDTGAVLAVERPKMAELEVIETAAGYSKAKMTGDLEVALEVGDEVEPESHGLKVAVCPLLNENGTLTNVGAGIAEDLTTTLVQRKVTVVERSVLDMVLAELLAQNTILFDQKSAQKLGQLTGANVVLTGKIIPSRNTGKAYVRLIDVGTGKILFAVSASVNIADAAPVGRPGVAAGPGTSARPGSAGTAPPQEPGGRKSARLGASRVLPSFLTTESRYERTEEQGIRLQGHDQFSIREAGSVRTKETNYLTRDFTFEVLLTFGPGDRIAYIGLGPGKPDRSYNGLTDSIYLRFHAPNLADGLVDVTGFRKPYDTMEHVKHGGTHLVRIIKEGDSVTFFVDPENDGPTDDDLELTIPNIRTHAPFFNSKNMPLFFGGSGTFVEVSVRK